MRAHRSPARAEPPRGGLLTRFLAFVVGSALAVACGGSSVETRRTSCASDADCASGERCTAGAERPARLPLPCDRVVPCATGSDCQSDEVCAPYWQNALAGSARCAPKSCSPRCAEQSCPTDAECGADGVCALTPCDAPGALACPELWMCDPHAATSASSAPSEGIASSEEDIERQMARGCVRAPCDQAGGYTCASGWSCDPSATDNPAGCVADDCTKTGHCADDVNSVCLNQATHPEGQAPDANGCIERTCEDGRSCSWLTAAGIDVGRCQYGAPDADFYGCIVLPCEVDADCAYDDFVCDHDSALGDARGCRIRSCTEGKPCASGLVCAPEADIRGFDDCALLDPGMSSGRGGTSGSGGSAGTSGTGGSAGTSGTAGTGGTTTLNVPHGECVAR